MRTEKRLGNLSSDINRGPFGTGTVSYCINEFSVTYPGVAIRTGSQEK